MLAVYNRRGATKQISSHWFDSLNGFRNRNICKMAFWNLKIVFYECVGDKFVKATLKRKKGKVNKLLLCSSWYLLLKNCAGWPGEFYANQLSVRLVERFEEHDRRRATGRKVRGTRQMKSRFTFFWLPAGNSGGGAKRLPRQKNMKTSSWSGGLSDNKLK